MELCPACGHAETRITEQTFSTGAIHLRVECAKCFKFLRFAPKPINEAAAEVLSEMPELATMTRSELVAKIGQMKRQYDYVINLLHAEVVFNKHQEKIKALVIGEA